jgi:hypothetical protein
MSRLSLRLKVGLVMGKRYCNTCELPQNICACAEAKAYDEANPFVDCKRDGCSYTGEPLACKHCHKPYVKSNLEHYP